MSDEKKEENPNTEPKPEEKKPEPGHENVASPGAPPVVVDPSIRG